MWETYKALGQQRFPVRMAQAQHHMPKHYPKRSNHDERAQVPTIIHTSRDQPSQEDKVRLVVLELALHPQRMC